ncbi:MAG: hypothetical protein AABN95_15555 [Acidobacteriota bacterium]
MKRCPKCSRSYPDENQKFCTFDGGLLVTADTSFDPNATVQLSRSTVDSSRAESFSEETRDLAATIAGLAAPTSNMPRSTGPTGSQTVYERAPTPPPRPPNPPVAASPRAAVTSEPAGKKSKLPLILGILLLLLVLGVGAVVALFFLVIKPQIDGMESDRPVVTKTDSNDNAKTNDNVNTTTEKTTTDDEVIPPNTIPFANSNSNLDGKLAEHYFDFSFYYPNSWQTDQKAGTPGASNFVKVERRLPPDFTQENFAVGWYTSRGTYEADESTFPQLVEILGASLAKGFPEYRKVSEGPTKVNSLDGYEFRFVSVSKGTEKGDIDLWGRVIFLPPGVSGEQAGATLILLATSLAPELSGVDDVGVKGETPVILESFRFGKKP